MANTLEYIFSLTDQVSTKLDSICISSDKTLNIFAGLQGKTNEVKNTFDQTGRTLGALREKVSLLQAEREWIPAENVKGVKAYNTEIKKLTSEIDKLENTKGGGFKNWCNNLTASVPLLKTVLNPLVLISAATYKVTQSINAGLSAWNAQTEAETKLSAVMRNTMNATDDEVKAILRLTEAQQKLGVIGDEIQIAGAQELATYVSRRDSIEKLLPCLNDMLAQQYGLNATQEQAATIAGMLGKVMDGQVGALSRYGYKFTEAQEKILKHGKESERAAVLAEVIGEAVGGVNASLAATPEGRWKQHENDMGDLSERVGKLAVSFRASLFPIIETFGVLFENIIEWFEDNSEVISEAIEKVTSVTLSVLRTVYNVLSKIVGAFVWLFTELNNGNPIVLGIAAAVGAYTAALTANYIIQQKAVLVSKLVTLWNGIQAAGTTVLTAAQWALNTAFYASPLGWVALAIGAVVAAVAICWKKFEGFRKVVYGAWGVVKEFGKSLVKSVVDPFKQVLRGIGGVCSAIMELMQGNFMEAARLAKQGFKDMGEGFVKGSPVGIAVNTFQNGNYADAWEQGKQNGVNQETDGEEETEDPAAGVPDVPPPPEIDDPTNSIKERKGSGRKKTLNLNDLTTVQDHNATAAYTAIAEKLTPVSVSVKPNENEAAPVVSILPPAPEPPAVSVASPIVNTPPAMAAVQPVNVINEAAQSYEPKQEDTIKDIMLNVRKIAAAASVPFMLALPTEAEATQQPQAQPFGIVETFTPNQTANNGKTINVDRICENIVIQIENTDRRGVEEIRTAVYQVLNEIAEG